MLQKQLLRERNRIHAKHIQAQKNAERFRVGDWRWCYWYRIERKWAVKLDRINGKINASATRQDYIVAVEELSNFKPSHRETTDRYHKNLF